MELTELQVVVINQLGYDALNEDSASILNDVMNSYYGAAAGFTGFIYYSDTTEFFDKNKQVIFNQLLEDRWSIGYNSITEMLSSFNCFKDVDTFNIEQFLIDTDNEDNEDITTIKNGLSWYALECVAYQLEEEIEEILEK